MLIPSHFKSFPHVLEMWLTSLCSNSFAVHELTTSREAFCCCCRVVPRWESANAGTSPGLKLLACHCSFYSCYCYYDHNSKAQVKRKDCSTCLGTFIASSHPRRQVHLLLPFQRQGDWRSEGLNHLTPVHTVPKWYSTGTEIQHLHCQLYYFAASCSSWFNDIKTESPCICDWSQNIQ